MTAARTTPWPVWERRTPGWRLLSWVRPLGEPWSHVHAHAVDPGGWEWAVPWDLWAEDHPEDRAVAERLARVQRSDTELARERANRDRVRAQLEREAADERDARWRALIGDLADSAGRLARSGGVMKWILVGVGALAGLVILMRR